MKKTGLHNKFVILLAAARSIFKKLWFLCVFSLSVWQLLCKNFRVAHYSKKKLKVINIKLEILAYCVKLQL
jgi:hypothetical protein